MRNFNHHQYEQLEQGTTSIAHGNRLLPSTLNHIPAWPTIFIIISSEFDRMRCLRACTSRKKTLETPSVFVHNMEHSEAAIAIESHPGNWLFWANGCCWRKISWSRLRKVAKKTPDPDKDSVVWYDLLTSFLNHNIYQRRTCLWPPNPATCL